MLIPKQTTIPALVRVKPGALDRMGIYAERHELLRVVLFFSQGLDGGLLGQLTASLRSRNIQILQQTSVESIGFERATELFRESPRNADAIIGFGGGKAVDVAKYVGFLGRHPCCAYSPFPVYCSAAPPLASPFDRSIVNPRHTKATQIRIDRVNQLTADQSQAPGGAKVGRGRPRTDPA
jgi:glycerol dehydrogenase-like iron-containing ADH family enzyme